MKRIEHQTSMLSPPQPRSSAVLVPLAETSTRKAVPDFPAIILENHTLRIGQTVCDLASRPITYDLLKIFMETQSMTVPRYVLIEKMFGHNFRDLYSPRFVSGKLQNLTKLISRARMRFSRVFAAELSITSRWFVYDHIDDTWTLIKPF